MLQDSTKDDYRPREHDHMVEPMFGGLGMKEEPRPMPQCQPEETEPDTDLRPLMLRLWRWFLGLVRPSGPSSGR